jgi:hypothetical protein
MRRTTEDTLLLTTNQKVAGSSPAERAPLFPANGGASPFSVASSRGVDHLFDHLSLREAPKSIGLDVRHDVGVGVHRLVYAGVRHEDRPMLWHGGGILGIC